MAKEQIAFNFGEEKSPVPPINSHEGRRALRQMMNAKPAETRLKAREAVRNAGVIEKS